MAEITLDLATKIVPKTQKLWAVFPGKGRRLLDLFLEKDIIFLETPGINLAPKILENDDLLRRHVAMSIAKLKYIQGELNSPPPRNPNAYELKRNASFNSAVGNVRNMFLKMQPGDLVIVGGKSQYRPVHIGEVVGNFNTEDQLLVPFYDRNEVPVRHIRWLNVHKERRFLPERLSALLSNRHAVISISKEEFGEAVYTIAYGDFVFGEDSRYVFDGPKYNNIARSTIPGIDLLSYFVAAFHATDENELDKFGKLGVDEGIKQYFEQDILYSFELEFASPGGYVIHARQAALALTVALLVSATSGTISYSEARAATVVNSADRGQAAHQPALVSLPIPEKYKAIMDNMKADKFNELVKLNQEAQAGVGLRVRVKQRHKKP